MVVDELYRDAADREVSSGFSFNADVLQRALRNIYYRKYDVSKDLDGHLLEEVNRIINSATDIGFSGSEADGEFMRQLRSNNEVFAAFKTHRMGRDIASRLIGEDGETKSFQQFKEDVQSITSHHVEHWLRTEYDTAIKRAQQAADMMQYRAEADVLPNLEWLPSTAMKPREDHILFYHHIWAIDDPFWEQHKPGDQWGCQCDLAPTDKPVTDNSGLGGGNIAKPSAGLSGNPSRTGIIFSDDHPYFPSDCNHCAFKSTRLHIFSNKQKNCYQCANIIKVIKEAKLVPIIEEYERLRADENYTDVKIDRKSGGLRAMHIGHNSESNGELHFNGQYTSFDLEKECQERLFRLGHKAILCDESKQLGVNTLPAIDMELDGRLIDIKSITGSGWYSHALMKKNNQLVRYHARPDNPPHADSVCLYFHDADLFDEDKIGKSISFFKQKLKEPCYIKHILCVVNGRDDILWYEV